MACRRGPGTRDHHQVEAGWEIRAAPPVTFANPPFHPVAQHGSAHLAADGNPDPTATRKSEQKKSWPRDPAPAVLDREIFLSAPHTRGAREKRAPTLQAHLCGQGPKTLLLSDRDGELPAPFAPTAADDLAASRRPHALSKPVRALSALAMRLKRPLHDILRESFRALAGRRARRLKAELNSIA